MGWNATYVSSLKTQGLDPPHTRNLPEPGQERPFVDGLTEGPSAGVQIGSLTVDLALAGEDVIEAGSHGSLGESRLNEDLQLNINMDNFGRLDGDVYANHSMLRQVLNELTLEVW
jgi:hypothetical protein